MFGRKSTPAPEVPDTTTEADPRAPKGRPTPSRREAEAARKQALKVPKDPKAARKAARERDREARNLARQALQTGDERHLPARDRGPVRAYVRDFVDSRFTVAEYFIFIALAVLVFGFIPHPVVQFITSMVWMLLVAIIVVDTAFLSWRLNKQLKERWPAKSERRGALLYAVLRTIQLRRLRLPPPKVKRGGQPVTPKQRR